MDSLVPFLERSPWPSSWARCKDSVPTPSADAIGRRNAKCWGLGSPKRFLHRYTDTPIHRYTDTLRVRADTPIHRCTVRAVIRQYTDCRARTGKRIRDTPTQRAHRHIYTVRTDTPRHRHKRSDQRNGINSAIGGNGVSAQK